MARVEDEKVQFGLNNLHYAVLNEADDGTITYSKPVRIKGVVSLSLDPKGDKIEFFADDSLYYNKSYNQGYTGELAVSIIPDSFKIDVLGFTTDKNGVLFENSEAVPQNIALLFEFQNDKRKSRHLLYNVSVSRPKVEASTTTNSTEPKTDKIPVTIIPRPDTKYVKCKCTQGDTAYNTWFNNVYEYQPTTSSKSILEV